MMERYAITVYLRIDKMRLSRGLHLTRMIRIIVAASWMVVGCMWHLSSAPVGLANPANPAVVAGEATVSGIGTDLVTIQQASQHAIIHWSQFNIAPSEVTSFLQPVGGIALNRIFDASPSLINGALNATGTVFLLNPNGVLFGANAQVNVGGLVASTLHMTDADFLAGIYRFGGAATHLGLGDTALNSMVRNEGEITAGPFGAYLFAHNVENSGIIRSPNGHIALAAGASAYLSNRPDGRGLFVEVTAPTGQATNLKDLVADGGQVSLFGKVVNQSGLIQANSVQQRNGRVELIATDAVMLADGSRILARGDAAGVSNGGTVLAKAGLQTGQTNFQKGALIDVSGGAQGGNGGFIELSASKVTWEGAFRAHALSGYRGGKLLIDPIFNDNPITTQVLEDLAAQIQASGFNDIEFQSPLGQDLRVTGQYDLANGWLLPAGQTGTLRFNAGKDLIFTNAKITNGDQGLNPIGTKWDYELFANNDIVLTSSVVSTGFGGKLTLESGKLDPISQQRGPTGDIRLVNISSGGNNTNGYTILETFAGGDITITTLRDLLAPSESVSPDNVIEVVTGIRVNGTGNLMLNVGRDWLGGSLGTRRLSPGFLLTRGTATVNVGRNVGSADAPANLTVGGGVADPANPFNKLSEVFRTDVNITAAGDVFLGLVQDRGLTEGITVLQDTVLPMFTVHPDSTVKVLSTGGNISLDPRFRTMPLPISQTGKQASFRLYYPASFDVRAPNGSIFVQSNLNFWPSLTGRLVFLAKTDIKGIQQPGTPERDPRFKPVFVGFSKNSGQWELVEIATAETDRRLVPFLNAVPPPGVGSPPTAVLDQWAFVPTLLAPPSLNLVGGDLTTLQGGLVRTNPSVFNTKLTSLPTGVDPNHAVQEMTFKTQEGDISGLRLNLVSEVFKKVTTIEAGRDLGVLTLPSGDRVGGVFASFFTPAGVTSTVSAGGNMDFAKSCGNCDGGLALFGPGTSKVRVGSLDSAGNLKPGTGNLDLGDGQGITHRADPRTNLPNLPGFLDIAIGNNLVMTRSRVASANGANIWIHGLGTRPALDSSNNPSVELVVGVKEAGTNIVLVDGRPVKINGQPIVLDGTQPVITTGSVVLDRPGAQINGKSFSPVIAKGKPIIVDGRIVLLVDGLIQLVDASIVTIEQGVGGIVRVGSLASGGPVGILTERGGSIDIKAEGNVDVFKSRIATLGGGNVAVSSVSGDINAGTGGRDEAIEFKIEQTGTDALGRPLAPITILVPGSGIFTFHPSDPKFPLNFPKFDTPQITALKGEIVKQNFLGRNTASLESQVSRLVAAREPEYRQIFEQFITQNPGKPEVINGVPTGRFLPLELGDINLRAGQDLVVPSAGIRGRRIRISAGRNLDLQGGTVEGEVQFDVAGSVKGNLSSFVGAFSGTSAIGGTVSGGASAGGSSLGGGLSGVTGTVAATASSTSSSSGTASKTVEAVQEKTAEASTQSSRAAAQNQTAAAGQDGQKKAVQTVKVKRGVVIQVDVKPEVKPAS